MKTPSKSIATSIRSIEDCRQTHVDWIEWYKAHPKQERIKGKVAGDVKHHRLWVRRYNQVLRVLRAKGDAAC